MIGLFIRFLFTGDGSSSEMELTPQLVSAAIQRATADSSGSDNECSNSNPPHQNTSHYASSLLQQFEVQTQLLSSSASITPMVSTPALVQNPMDGVGSISDCVLGQINNLPEIPLASTFLNTSHHLSPQQTEELSQINKDLEEITTASVGITSSLEDCVDNNDFIPIGMTHSSELGSSSDLLKNSPLTIPNAAMTPQSQSDNQKFDTVSTNSVESQDDVKVVVESRRKRGRPRKVRDVYDNKLNESRRENKSIANVIIEYPNNNDPPNVSPDSGILSNHNSPTHSPLRRHELDISHRINKKSPQKENTIKERKTARSKSRGRRGHRSDSSDSEYQRKRIIDNVRHIKSEAPSPVPLKHEQNKYEKPKKNDHKLDIAALDRMLYATDRVLYPPRKKVGRRPQNKTKTGKIANVLKEKSQSDSNESDDDSIQKNLVLSGVYAKRKEINKLASLSKKNNKNFNNTWRDNQSENETAADDPLDPTWKQIDLNPKYKDILSGYKSDHEFKPYRSCSRLIESGYRSDYGCRSGYRSDHYRSGYKSDYKSGYKTDRSGYKTDYSIRSQRRRMRKLKKSRSMRDRSYYKNQKCFVSDQEILLLAKKANSTLNLGNDSSDSEREFYLRKSFPSPKYISVSTKYQSSKYSYGFSKLNKQYSYNSSDPFAPGPVFSGLNKTKGYNMFKINHNNNNTLLKSPFKISYIGCPLPALKPVFTHKFGSSPICTVATITKRENETYHRLFDSRNLSPKSRKSKDETNLFISKKDSPKKLIPNVFEKAKNTYVPSKSVAKNVFLHFRKPNTKPTLNVKKQRRTVVLAPPKINLKPKPIERLSRISIKTESKHHRHRSKRRHRSRSASRCRDSNTKPVESLDQKHSEDVENLINNFIKLCQIAPKVINPVAAAIKNSDCKIQETTKIVKRNSKKRKTSDNQEINTPTSKRRHKKQLTESQSKGGKDTNEHKLPLKKRHYHINSSTSNSISLSLMSSEFEDNSKNGNSPEKFLCTETDCMGDLSNKVCEDTLKNKTGHDKNKKFTDVVRTSEQITSSQDGKTDTSDDMGRNVKPNANLNVAINTEVTGKSSEKYSPNSSNCTDDELALRKPGGEQSELSKKIFETSEKLKAVHKMVHDLEKSLPKSKENDAKGEVITSDGNKISSPKAEAKTSPLKNTAPIVTPKKRHRLEAEKVSHSSLDQVVQSLSKKLSEDVSNLDDMINKDDCKKSKEHNTDTENNISFSSSCDTINNNNNVIDPLKTMSARSLYKSSMPPAQKSEIMTRKKNRLEGLTSNLVSKINPSAATKVLDTLLNNNIRKSIESRILEKEKNICDNNVKNVDEKNKIAKETFQISTRATVIKSPISKGKAIDTKKSRTSELSIQSTIVVNVDQPTGIFEPSIDLEDQIPKSSICVNNVIIDRSKAKTRGSDKNKLLLNILDSDPDVPLSILSETSESIISRPRRGESIVAVLSDKLSESSGHNLRQTKRNLSIENEELSDKKKKKIIRDSKLVLPPKINVTKAQIEQSSSDSINNALEMAVKKDSDPVEKNPEQSTKKKIKRRKTINRTGFPSIRKKKKKVEPITNPNIDPDQVTLEDIDSNSAFERVPKDGEAMSSFIERTFKKTELKVILNKEECPKQGRLTVVSLEKLQGKDNNNVIKSINKNDNHSKYNKKSANSILRAPSLQLNNTKSDKDQKSHVNKWEVLSETDSIRSLASSLGNDPEDSIPLSLLNLKSNRSNLHQNDNLDRLKRKTRALSPSQEVEDIICSKRRYVETNNVALRPKSSMAVLCPSERRLTRSSDSTPDENKIKLRRKESKTLIEKAAEKVNESDKARSIGARRKSRSYQVNKKLREVTPSSRDSSLDTLRGYKGQCKSRETSVDTSVRDQDENEPLPLNEKEIDFEKSIDVLSKSIICKKRMASSRDESPASSVDRGKEREKPAISKRNPRLRKKFLVAGLFSDYYKEE